MDRSASSGHGVPGEEVTGPLSPLAVAGLGLSAVGLTVLFTIGIAAGGAVLATATVLLALGAVVSLAAVVVMRGRSSRGLGLALAGLVLGGVGVGATTFPLLEALLR